MTDAKWQPIETAPRDGTRVMLGNAAGVWVADWIPVYRTGYRPDDPWHSALLNHDHIRESARYEAPTHWMPLPPPPDQPA